MNWNKILRMTLLVGSLDIIAACVNGYLRGGIMPETILKFIASGIFGQTAFVGGFYMMGFGLLFHFIIAFACAAIFFFSYPYVGFLKYSHILNSLLIGFIAWGVTNQVIMPLSKAPAIPFNLTNEAIAIGILTICIGLPLSIAAKNQ